MKKLMFICMLFVATTAWGQTVLTTASRDGFLAELVFAKKNVSPSELVQMQDNVDNLPGFKYCPRVPKVLTELLNETLDKLAHFEVGDVYIVSFLAYDNRYARWIETYEMLVRITNKDKNGRYNYEYSTWDVVR